MSGHAAPTDSRLSGAPQLNQLVTLAQRCWLAIAIAASILAACFYATGGLALGTATTTEMLLTLGSGCLVVLAALQERARSMPLFGVWGAVAFLLLAAYTALSVGWSVEPSDSLIEAGRTFSYAALFAGAVALVRLSAGRWRSVLAGVLLATACLALYAVLTMIFPGSPGIGTTYARLNAPFSYWNIVGLTAALGVPPALWLGARRDADRVSAGLAPALICLALVTVMLSYSRGALLALIAGLIFWFVFVPLRLRSAALLAVGAAGAAIVVGWAFAQAGLTTDYVPGSVNSVPWSAHLSSGHALGAILLAVLLACAAAGLRGRLALQRRPFPAAVRERAGRALIVCVALVPVIAVIGLAVSSRGLFGSISHDVSTLTNTNVSVPNSASRLTALGSERAIYWRDAIDAFDANPLVGLGAGSYATAHTRYDTSFLQVYQAHGYLFQTLADLGLVGLLLSMLLAGAWIASAWHTTGGLRVRSTPGPAESAERIGLLTMVTVVVIFAVHATFDFDWFVPGAMMIALLCAGWVAGRGAHDGELAPGTPSLGRLRSDPWAPVIAASVAWIALLVAWIQWQPLRSSDSVSAAETALVEHQYKLGAADARSAQSENGLDYSPLIVLADAQFDMHHARAAYDTIVRAVKLEPSNPETWYQLAYFDYYSLGQAKAALQADQRAIFLDPQDDPAYTDLYLALLPADY